MAPKAVTLRLGDDDYRRLHDEADRLGMKLGTLARVLVRSGLGGEEAERRRRRGVEALEALDRLRDRLPDEDHVDVVDLIRRGRDERERRMAGLLWPSS